MTQNTHLQKEKMLKSTVWSTIGNFASRFLGLIYVIPWYAWLGQQAKQANALFTMGYNIYAYFLLISTAGIPVAISKQIAKYHAKDEADKVYPMLRNTLLCMGVLGMIMAVLMYLAAPAIAILSGSGLALIPVIHSLSLAVVIFPVMSVIRGIFQGYANLKPYAMSQIAEQVIRVIWILLFTFMIMKMSSGSHDYVDAVTQSTFAAFVGMVASLMLLIYYLHKEGLLASILSSQYKANGKETLLMLFETLKEAIPFIITGSAIQLFQLIDQVTFINTMHRLTTYSQKTLEDQFAYFSGNPNKIIMMLVAVALSIGGVGIPLLTENHTKGDTKASANLIVHNLTMLFFLLIPAVMGGILLAKPIYTFFYEVPNGLALALFIVCLVQTLILAMYTVSSPMLQALFENKRGIHYFLEGVAIKLLAQLPCIYLAHAYGPLIATTLGLGWAVYRILRRIYEVTAFDGQLLLKRLLAVSGYALLAGVLAGLSNLAVALVLPVTGKVSSVVHLLVSGTIFALVYGVITLYKRLLDILIGEVRADVLRKRLHLS